MIKKLLIFLISFFITTSAFAATELDYMEYANNAAAQLAYVTNGGGLTDEISNGGMETWSGGDNVAPDGWTLGGTGAAVAKESTTIKVGTYSAKVISNTTNDAYLIQDIATSKGIAYWKGKVVTVGLWIWCATANRAYILAYEGGSGASTASSKHTGDSTWQYFYVSHLVTSGATSLLFYINILSGASSVTAYFDGGKAVEGYAIGSGELVRLQSYSESTIKTQGTYALKGVAAITDSLNKTLTRTIGTPLDLTGLTQIKYGEYAGRTGSNIKIGIHDTGGTTTEHTANISSAGAWETQTWDISAVTNANKDAIDNIIVTIVNADAANTFYVDNMYGESAARRIMFIQ